MSFSFRNEVVKFLKENINKTYTAREISVYIADKFPDACEEKIKNSKNGYLKTEEDCIGQWVREISSDKNALLKKGISITANRPRKYYYSNKITIETSENTNEAIKKNLQPEKELYPVLAQFCESKKIKTLRIDEKKSENKIGKNYNEWIHADVVGFQDLTNNFNEKTKKCLIEYADERSCLYSFEVKDGQIETWNLRKYFFQTVSNSSWANYSYLVAEGVNDDADDELRLLCSSFGIGYIELDKETPEDSKIIINAPKTPLDWNMINRIANVNKDFQKYLNNITLVYQGHSNPNTQQPDWDIN